jgi:hypothetical protein
MESVLRTAGKSGFEEKFPSFKDNFSGEKKSILSFIRGEKPFLKNCARKNLQKKFRKMIFLAILELTSPV